MKKFSKLLSGILAATMILSFAGCATTDQRTDEEVAAQQAAEAEASILQQNDYRGGVKRALAMKEFVLDAVEAMKANNTTIRETSPNSFWTTDGYQDFVSTFLVEPLIEDTIWFNEEETDWDTIVTQMASVPSSYTKASNEGYAFINTIAVNRLEKDDYLITGVPSVITVTVDGKTTSHSSNAECRVLYDCDKDWCKAYVTMSVNDELPLVTAQLFEYRRVDGDTFAIQTGRERLLVKFAPVTEDTNIQNRQIKEFYYSKLVGEGLRTTFEPYEPLPEIDEYTYVKLTENVKQNDMWKDFPFMNDKGDLAMRYGENNSMFFVDKTGMTHEWVFEDKALQQGICYKDGVLVVTTYNKLSDNYERFVYARSDADASLSGILEDMVQINKLVGVQNTEEVVTTVVPEDTEGTTESTEATDAPAEDTTANDAESVPDSTVTEQGTVSEDVVPDVTTLDTTTPANTATPVATASTTVASAVTSTEPVNTVVEG